MKIDLHVHSRYSDGSETVEAIIDLAKQSNIEVLSFVDHDTTVTYQQALPYAKQQGITLIPGVEISAYDFKRQRKVHVLGYGYQLPATHITQLCEPLLQQRRELSAKNCEYLRSQGYDLSQLQSSLTGVVYKQHIMDAICEHPYTTAAYKTLYQSLFKGDGPCADSVVYLDVYQAIKAIKQDGGKVVIAHPGQLHSFELIDEIYPLIDGIEVAHPDHTSEDIVKVNAYANKYQKKRTGGSDYHGRFWLPYPLGYGEIPLEIFELLKD